MDTKGNDKTMNELLHVGNNVKAHHLPTYTRYDLQTKPDGTRIYNPLSLSKLSATLAVANTNPVDVQR